MKRFSTLVAAAALVALALGTGRALAQTNTTTTTLPVQASVTQGCFVSAVGINFGAVSPLVLEEDISEPYDATGSVTIACGTFGPTSGTAIIISLDNGANGLVAPLLGIGTATTAIRAMTNGTSFLAYDLFKPTASTLGLGNVVCTTGAAGGEWGSGFGAPALTGVTGGATGLVLSAGDYNVAIHNLVNNGAAFISIPVCGSIPADQVQPLTPGVYTDTVTVTLQF